MRGAVSSEPVVRAEPANEDGDDVRRQRGPHVTRSMTSGSYSSAGASIASRPIGSSAFTTAGAALRGVDTNGGTPGSPPRGSVGAYPRRVIEVGKRKRNQPAPPRVVYEALVTPDRDPDRPWLRLAVDEQPPEILDSIDPELVVWSSLWPSRPDAVLRFELPADAGGQGTDLTWTLLVDEPEPEPDVLGHLRKRINVLINAELRYSFGR